MAVYPGGVWSRTCPRSGISGASGVAQLRQHGRTQQLQLLCSEHIPDAEQDVLGARVAQLAEAVDDLGGRLALGSVAAYPKAALQRRAFDVVVRSSNRLAMRSEDLPLVVDLLRAAEHVRGVRVLRDEAERLPLATAADHDRDTGAGDGLRRVEQARRLVVAAGEGALRPHLPLEHLVGDLERLLEQHEADPERREVEAEARGFLLVPRRAEA